MSDAFLFEVLSIRAGAARRSAGALLMGLLACAGEAAAQNYVQASHFLGSLPVGGITVTVTNTGSANIGSPCGPAAGPYLLHPGDNYVFTFSAPVGSVKIPAVFAANSAGDAHFTVNGSSYALTAANLTGPVASSTCSDGVAAVVAGGDLTNIGNQTLNPNGEILIPGPVTSIIVSNTAPAVLIFGMFIAPMTYFQVTNTSGTSTVNGIAATVTSSGATDNASPCGGVTAPYYLSSAPAQYNFSFSPPVAAATVAGVFANLNHSGEVHFVRDGAGYPLAASNVTGTAGSACDPGLLAAISGGDLVNTGNETHSPNANVVIPGPMSSLSVVNVDLTYFVHGLFISAGAAPALSFTSASPHAYSILRDASGAATSIASMLSVNGANVGLPLTWVVVVPPAHGTVGGLPFNTPAANNAVSPPGATYTPNAGYLGSDSFAIMVFDGVNTTTATFDVTVTALDPIPDAFTFAPQILVPLGTTTATSNAVVVSGINGAAPISIANGSYSINGGAFTSASGTVNNGDSVRVRQTSAAAFLTTTTATLTIGAVAGSFNVTTINNGQVSTGSGGSQRVDGVAVSVQSSGSASIVVACGQASAPYLFEAAADSYTFTFSKPVAGVRFPVLFGTGNAGQVHFTVNGNPYSLTSTNLAGVVNVTGSCTPGVSAGISGGDLVNSGNTGANAGAVVVIPGPVTSITLSSAAADVVFFGMFITPISPFDFDATGSSDVLWQHADGRAAIWLMNGLIPTASAEILGAGSGWSVVQAADMDGDGNVDLVWQHTDGRVAIYLMNGIVPTSTRQILNAGGGWTAIQTPDLNGDGKADLIFQNTDGSVAAWTMNGTTMIAGATLIGPGTGWSVIAKGDFDGDGKDDLLWRHTDGRHAIWLMDGVAVKSTSRIMTAGFWTAIHVADLDGDGKADILWRHADGTLAAWLMNGTAFVGGTTLLGQGSGWNITRVGDFDGDGKADLFFLHTDGRAAIWLMDGLVPTMQTQILNAGSGWSAKRLADLNGDGKADIVWENIDGSVAVWLMNGTAMASGAGVLGSATGWTAFGTLH